MISHLILWIINLQHILYSLKVSKILLIQGIREISGTVKITNIELYLSFNFKKLCTYFQIIPVCKVIIF